MSRSIQPILDHIVINVRTRLDEGCETYRKLGFHPTKRGHHPFGTSNHLLVFGETYVELLGLEPGNEHKRPDLLAFPPGVTGLVFKTTDSSALHDAIEALGIPVEAPFEFVRPVTLPSGPAEARFRTVRLGADLVRNGRTFFCHHFTPELIWRDEWRDHPNGVTEILGLVIASETPGDTASLYGKLFGPEILTADGDGYVFQAGPARIHILPPAEVDRRFGEIEATTDGSERMVALALRTRSTAALRALLDANGIASRGFDDGSVLVQAKDAAGVALRFFEGGKQ
ncbi:VOC family protein [Telmatospirillum siberiense]|uniref:VOC family protein n=1 Tax=Telmatospirillum siberiense TaxID=382514 RepID=A0A2N3PNX8_9PROT|nr:VOC family protein [Telmatospirillum siberiense]PKU22097.1 VOC family protein [Telmatospirillum siberiense]